MLQHVWLYFTLAKILLRHRFFHAMESFENPYEFNVYASVSTFVSFVHVFQTHFEHCHWWPNAAINFGTRMHAMDTKMHWK